MIVEKVGESDHIFEIWTILMFFTVDFSIRQPLNMPAQKSNNDSTFNQPIINTLLVNTTPNRIKQ